MIKLSNLKKKSEKWRIYTSTKSSHNHIAAEFYYPKERRLDDPITKVWSTIADL